MSGVKQALSDPKKPHRGRALMCLHHLFSFRYHTAFSSYNSSLTLFLAVFIFPLALFAQEEEHAPLITVTATPFTPSLLEYGEPASVMNEDDIEHRMSSTLGETLQLEAGVRSSFFGQGASRPIIRGFSGDRVRILKNGVSTGDVSDISEDHVVAADPMQAQQIEILRGPETLLYGSSAIGGAVNVTDDSIPEISLGTPVQGKVLGQLGNSADDERTIGIKMRGESEKINWHLSGFNRTTADYTIPGFAESQALRDREGEEENREHEESGTVPNTDTKSWGATIGGSYVWDNGFLGLSLSGFDSDYGIPGHAHEEKDSDGVRIDAQQQRLDMRGRMDAVNNFVESLKFRMALSDYAHDEIEAGNVATTYRRDSLEARLELLHSPVASLQGALGIQMVYDDFSALGEETFLNPVKTFSPALFFFESTSLSDSVELRFGGRIESAHLDPVGYNSREFTPISVSAGPVWKISQNENYTLGLTMTYAERAPNALELFSEGQHLARQIYERGNIDLNKEASLGVDLVLQKNYGILTGSITPFYQSFSNYINLTKSTETIEELPVYTYGEVDAYFWGFEIQSAIHIDKLLQMSRHHLSLEYQSDYVKARNKSFSSYMPRTPPLRNVIRARYQYEKTFEAILEGVFVEDQNDISAFELPTNGYQLLNAEIGFTAPRLFGEKTRIFLKGSNLTNDEARTHSSFLKDLAPMRGRALLIGFRANL